MTKMFQVLVDETSWKVYLKLYIAGGKKGVKKNETGERRNGRTADKRGRRRKELEKKIPCLQQINFLVKKLI